MSETDASAETWRLDSAGGLLVEFTRRADRIEASIETSERERRGPLLDWSDAGDSYPAFQEIHRQDHGDHGDLFFLTGMSAGRYWSACLSRSAEGGILFDIACRYAGDHSDLRVAFTLGKQVAAETNEGSISLVMEGASTARLLPQRIDGLGECRVEVCENHLLLSPAGVQAGAAPARWAFVLAR